MLTQAASLSRHQLAQDPGEVEKETVDMAELRCARCREPLLEDDAFCPACGAPNPSVTGAGIPSPPGPTSNAAKASPGDNENRTYTDITERSSDGSAQRSTQRTALITTAVVLLVALVGTVAFLAGRSGRTNEAVGTVPPAEQEVPVTLQSSPPSSAAASTAPQAEPATTLAPSTSVAASADDFDSMYLAFLAELDEKETYSLRREMDSAAPVEYLVAADSQQLLTKADNGAAIFDNLSSDTVFRNTAAVTAIGAVDTADWPVDSWIEFDYPQLLRVEYPFILLAADQLTGNAQSVGGTWTSSVDLELLPPDPRPGGLGVNVLVRWAIDGNKLSGFTVAAGDGTEETYTIETLGEAFPTIERNNTIDPALVPSAEAVVAASTTNDNIVDYQPSEYMSVLYFQLGNAETVPSGPTGVQMVADPKSHVCLQGQSFIAQVRPCS